MGFSFADGVIGEGREEGERGGEREEGCRDILCVS